MDFVIELLIQLIVQFVVEVLFDVLFEGAFRGLAHVLYSRVGRYVLATVLGFGFGLAWGNHLTGGAHWPRLLWVSVAFGAAALVLAMGRPREEHALARRPGLRQLWQDAVTPPWRWSSDRALGFFFINVGIATGILVSFRPAL